MRICDTRHLRVIVEVKLRRHNPSSSVAKVRKRWNKISLRNG